MRTSIRLVAAAAAVPLALLTAPAATAAGPTATAVTCGSEVSGKVVLTKDLNCTGRGLIVRASGTTIDLNGHTLRRVGGEEVFDNRGIEVGFDSPELPRTHDVTIRNGTIEGYAYAVYASYTEGLTVERLTTEDTLRSEVGQDLTVRKSRIAEIGFYYHGSALIEGNTLRYVGGSGGNMRIRNNRFPGGGVQLYESSDVEVTGNRFAPGGVSVNDDTFNITIADNVMTGVSLDGTRIEGITIRNNRIRNNPASGITVDSSSQSVYDVLIENNKITHSGFGPHGDWAPTYDGIHVPAPTIEGDVREVTLRGNRVRNSAGHGIFAPGAIDGGGNRAKGSKAAPECVGVICSK
ncbi:parallel beta helix pectate lyase-like protein [Kineococcus xinjiangensis]|uniref:Parallel beta helix pectate lyase-like protein n=1 Tax=Kineococcus xinjiangensis TaxID=512762 RepID=A0A2S6IMR2_9ACTN|nr:right-handed parallel beta-helix repeat-containing protein [Kineococcus xinjiangensis]PPK95430.1 parallel beta helix pectate lyase-like protein [Kineococcus xinjiangensis]